jgi:2-octaprenyl-6-methoxyphenol hydroxylase
MAGKSRASHPDQLPDQSPDQSPNRAEKRPPDRVDALIDVLVVGGGMAGMSLAAALGGAGLRVIVVDREGPGALVDADYDGRASAIAHGSQRALQAIGVWDAPEGPPGRPGMAAHAEPILDIRVSDGDSLLFLHYDHRELGTAPFGHMVENRATRAALLARMAALDTVELRSPLTLSALSREGPEVRARTSDGAEITAALAVAADGRNSALRREAGIAVTEWAYRQTGIVCTMGHERPHRGIAHERFLPSGPFAVLPMTDYLEPGGSTPIHRSSIVWTERTDLAPAFLSLDDAEFSRELGRRFGPHYGAVRIIGKRWSYPLALSHAETYIAPRLALIGDAAHAMHPIAGQGLNLGLRDVAALAEVLVDARRAGEDLGAATVLERYQRWRRFDSALLLAVTDGLNRLFSNDIPPLRLIRDLGLAAVNRLPPLKRLFVRHAMGTVGDLPRLVRGEAL